MTRSFSSRNFPALLFRELQDEFFASLHDFYSDVDEDEIRHAVSGSIKPFDAFSIKSAIDTYQPKSILEVGSFLGFSTRWICEVTSGMECKITSVDPRLRHRVFDNLKGHVEQFNAQFMDRLTLVDACLSEKDVEMFLNHYLQVPPIVPREEALRIIEQVDVINEPFAEFDFAFIDGDHTFSATQMNVGLAAQMMPKGGVILVHDAITWPDVIPALESMPEESGCKLIGTFGQEYYANVPQIKKPRGHLKRFIATRMLDYVEPLSRGASGIAIVEVAPSG